jgi:hypothetical protein
VISTASVHIVVEKPPFHGVNALIQLRSWRIAQDLGVFGEEDPHLLDRISGGAYIPAGP